MTDTGTTTAAEIADEIFAEIRSLGTHTQWVAEIVQKHLDEARADERRKMEKERDILLGGIEAVNILIEDSGGVQGLHLNGDIALWSDLRTSGRYEDWLLAFDDAVEILNQELHPVEAKK